MKLRLFRVYQIPITDLAKATSSLLQIRLIVAEFSEWLGELAELKDIIKATNLESSRREIKGGRAIVV